MELSQSRRNNEDCPTLLRFRDDLFRGFEPGFIVHEDGQFDDESGAAFGAVEALDAPSMLLDDAIADAEAEAGAFADRLGGEERVKT